jgi:hypothetical protein
MARAASMNRKAALEAVAVEALTSLVTYMIRRVHDYDPDHSGPEDEAEDYSRAVVEAALVLLARSDYRGELPHVLLTQPVPRHP